MAITTWVAKTKEKFLDIDDHLKEKTRTWSNVKGDVASRRERTIERNGGTEIEHVTVHPIKSKYSR
jgi:hypothetical protein